MREFSRLTFVRGDTPTAVWPKCAFCGQPPAAFALVFRGRDVPDVVGQTLFRYARESAEFYCCDRVQAFDPSALIEWGRSHSSNAGQLSAAAAGGAQ